MITSEVPLARFSQQVFPKRSTWYGVVVKNHAALSQYRYQEIDDVFETAGVGDVCDVKPVDICLIDPLKTLVSARSMCFCSLGLKKSYILHDICNHLRRTHRTWMKTPKRHLVAQSPRRPRFRVGL